MAQDEPLSERYNMAKYIKERAVDKGRYISLRQYAKRNSISYQQARYRVVNNRVEAVKVDWCYIIKVDK